MWICSGCDCGWATLLWSYSRTPSTTMPWVGRRPGRVPAAGMVRLPFFLRKGSQKSRPWYRHRDSSGDSGWSCSCPCSSHECQDYDRIVAASAVGRPPGQDDTVPQRPRSETVVRPPQQYDPQQPRRHGHRHHCRAMRQCQTCRVDPRATRANDGSDPEDHHRRRYPQYPRSCQ